jgi:heme exporter protein A
MRIAVDNLALERGGWRLFEGLSFTAAPGAHLALTGANGAGKTSLLRALAGFLRPAEGTIRFDGAAPEDIQHSMHVLGHRDGLKGALDVRAHVRFWAGLLAGDAETDAVLARVGLTRVADLPARVLSAGQGRRLALARLLVAPRPVWLLDEPAASLDASGKALLETLIAEHCTGGGAVIAAVHEPLGAPTDTVRLA